MFDNDRYITKGIRDSIPFKLQTFVWNCIDTLKGQDKQLDCVQIFYFSKVEKGIFSQGIIHKQRNSYSKISYKVLSKEIIYNTVLVIDDDKCTTMLLDEEYRNHKLLSTYFRSKLNN